MRKLHIIIYGLLLQAGLCLAVLPVFCQLKKTSSEKVKKAGKKVEEGYKQNNQDTLARGYYELGETYQQQGELKKSEEYFQKSKTAYEKVNDAEGVARSSRSLALVQEELNKPKEALMNFKEAQKNNAITNDNNSLYLNGNDVQRLLKPDSLRLNTSNLYKNIDLNIKTKDTGELISNWSNLGSINARAGNTSAAVQSFYNAFNYSKLSSPVQAVQLNQKITDEYLKYQSYDKAVAAKKELLEEPFVKNSTQLQAEEIQLLADIYIKKKQGDSALALLKQSYSISVANGHTLEAKQCIEKLDSIYASTGSREKSLVLYKDFLKQLPDVIAKDSSFADSKIVQETENRVKQLETEKSLKDDLIRRKNIFNYWLLGSVVLLAIFASIILFTVKKLRVKNKKIALQSLRREMNPHFIFNSLNSVNQFIANNNELEANRYLTRFSTLMRRVMENSKNDFVQFSKETELLQYYLELEKTRFPDKFDYNIDIDEALLDHEQLYIPGMLIQPHIENAIWHGLRHIEGKGFIQLSFKKEANTLVICIDDNGIGIEESKKSKTENQKLHNGRGIKNTRERISILNELYRQKITCQVEDKAAPEHGVRVTITVPLLNKIEHED